MKKITSLILVCALLVCCMFTFASCGKFGTYEGEVDIAIAKYKVTLEFSFSNVKVTTKASAFGSSDTDVYEGSFKITGEGDEMEIAFDFEEDCPIFSADSYDYAEGEDEDGKFVKIGLSKYYEKK